MKKCLIEMTRPGVAPLLQLVPTELCWTAGTMTSNLPDESVKRNGSSRVTGLVGRVVYGGLGNDCAGAPTSPENTWSQTPLVQPSRLLFLTRNCCCEPLITVPPENAE